MTIKSLCETCAKNKTETVTVSVRELILLYILVYDDKILHLRKLTLL